MPYQLLKKLLFIFSLVVTTEQVFADTDHAMAEFKKGNYQQAFNELKPLAEQGDARAQMNLGHLYDYGKGTAQDIKLAAKWYLKAANQGNDDAQFNIGNMYEIGDGLPQNLNLAASWYLKAASQGHLKAQASIAMLYDQGEGVPKDLKKAKEWYLKAANQGDATSQLGLCTILLSGDAANTKAAAEWALKAANQGLPLAQETLGLLYTSGIGVPKDIVKANYWLTKAAKQGKNGSSLSTPPAQQQTAKNINSTTADEIKFAELTKKARALWSDLKNFRYNPSFHKYAYWEGTKPGGEWNIHQKALAAECVSYRDSLPVELTSQYDLCMNISEMWMVGAEWANHKGNNTAEISRLILQIEKSLNNNGKFSL